jgi:hypothetical protein
MIRITAEDEKALAKFAKILRKNGIPAYQDEKKKKEKDENGEKKDKKKIIKFVAVDDEDFLPCVERLKESTKAPVNIKTKGKSISLILSGGDRTLDVVDDPEYCIPKDIEKHRGQVCENRPPVFLFDDEPEL